MAVMLHEKQGHEAESRLSVSMPKYKTNTKKMPEHESTKTRLILVMHPQRVQISADTPRNWATSCMALPQF
jgi:hypothetical protein